ncbi:endonuclease/exonuclease/phosphatase family protein [Paracoccus caeni]|uniref:Endonuclease/exonuclease/phosphatase family protein n=1 Tax=Paracoccus caeni TaxID=657651 RepID=A0A934SBV5_9RHOB|nr:endonuclease/exonuclease/phosphatase family protein [Paracoccus caeni]MBK4214868.1 endonuclease/exonuclease/phosphatase family protein [Paracoccus caeni]
MRGLTLIFAGLGLLTLLASYGGALHPAGDSMAVFRPVWAAILILSGLLLKGWLRLAALAAGLVALLPILWMMRPVTEPDGGVLVYQKNLLFTLRDPAAIIDDLRQSGADIVLLQEVSERNLSVPQALRDSHPYQLICPAHNVGAVAILSRWPFGPEPYCREGSGFAWAAVETPSGPISAAVLHLHWPWPFGQAAQVQRLLLDLQMVPQPVILGGDLNMVSWSDSVSSITAATGTVRVGPLRPTFILKRVYPMAIDHILAPKGWRSKAVMRDPLLSDHRGILARIVPE